MKILLSAFAFSPLLGSECGVGWHWALSMAKHHDVTVLTHEWFRNDVEAELARHPVPRLRAVYFHVEPFWTTFKRHHLDSQVYNTYWQIRVLRFAKALQAREHFELIHHLTLGSIRYPCWLGFAGVKYVVGPLGGGERAPAHLYKGTPWRGRLREAVRDLVLYSFCVDPFAQWALGRADIIFCRTADTAGFIPGRMKSKVVVAHEIGAPTPCPRPEPLSIKPRTTFLFAGRLLPLKGLHLAVAALADAVKQGADVGFHVVGDGEMLACLKEQALALGVADRIEFTARVPQVQLMAMYHDADAFLFPSLHDSGGTVVLESLSRGLPVICLDLGGPQYFLHPGCGTVVSTQGASQWELVSRLTVAIVAFSRLGQDERQSLHDEAIKQAAKLTWDHQVACVYEHIT
jgi:glycosyltransferase involved in cell wall biosynthesis